MSMALSPAAAPLLRTCCNVWRKASNAIMAAWRNGGINVGVAPAISGGVAWRKNALNVALYAYMTTYTYMGVLNMA